MRDYINNKNINNNTQHPLRELQSAAQIIVKYVPELIIETILFPDLFRHIERLANISYSNLIELLKDTDIDNTINEFKSIVKSSEMVYDTNCIKIISASLDIIDRLIDQDKYDIDLFKSILSHTRDNSVDSEYIRDKNREYFHILFICICKRYEFSVEFTVIWYVYIYTYRVYYVLYSSLLLYRVYYVLYSLLLYRSYYVLYSSLLLYRVYYVLYSSLLLYRVYYVLYSLLLYRSY